MKFCVDCNQFLRNINNSFDHAHIIEKSIVFNVLQITFVYDSI